MENVIDYCPIEIQLESFSLDEFLESAAPGTLSWLNMADFESHSVIPSFDNININIQFTPCQRLRAGYRPGQIESSGNIEIPDSEATTHAGEKETHTLANLKRIE